MSETNDLKSDLTFIVWSDTHFGFEPREGSADIRHQALDQMEHLDGEPWPASIGGCVDRPAFMLHCGDFVDGPNNGQELALYEAAMKTVSIAAYETLGNHDLANGNAVTWFICRHGGRYYAFDAGGVRFVSMYIPFGVYDTVPPMHQVQLHWLAEQVDRAAGRPMVFFSHGTPETLPNEEDFEKAISKANVALMLAGHTHLQAKFGPARYQWRGRPYLIAGHCRNHAIDPDFGRVFNVVRIRDGKTQTADWRWDLAKWA
ncbi:MAG: metallophosphoesterase [Planctomycetaceae bacterium]|nr:metallophosphoesterase [Planctomycetaceae bacterium]